MRTLMNYILPAVQPVNPLAPAIVMGQLTVLSVLPSTARGAALAVGNLLWQVNSNRLRGATFYINTRNSMPSFALSALAPLVIMQHVRNNNETLGLLSGMRQDAAVVIDGWDDEFHGADGFMWPEFLESLRRLPHRSQITYIVLCREHLAFKPADRDVPFHVDVIITGTQLDDSSRALSWRDEHNKHRLEEGTVKLGTTLCDLIDGRFVLRD